MIQTVIHAASGSQIQIHPYGATLLSYTTPTRIENVDTNTLTEHLFVSKLAVLDGSQPIRGGIPLVFPIFGPPPSLSGSTMPQHGFARRNTWTEQSRCDTVASAGIVYRLALATDGTTGRGEGNLWAAQQQQSSSSDGGAIDCVLYYSVTFNHLSLTVRLTIVNTASSSSSGVESSSFPLSAVFPLQALLHTYYKIQGGAALQPDQCFVKGLDGYILADKVVDNNRNGAAVAAGTTSSEPPLVVSIVGEVDRVYTPPMQTNDTNVLRVTIGVGDNRTLTLTASAGVAPSNVSDDPDSTTTTTSIPVSCVVWNPFVDKAAGMADFGNEEYHDMICVEPGILGNDILLHPGQEAWLEQIIRLD